MDGFDVLEEKVLNTDVCCGCGACAGSCPINVLEFRFNDRGEYRPYLVGECKPCSLCVRVCSMLEQNHTVDYLAEKRFGQTENIEFLPETGFFEKCFVGAAPDVDIRMGGSSGGVLTWLLCRLLDLGEIDYVITSIPNDDPDELFRYGVVGSADDLRKCSKSAYYPLELSQVLKTIRAVDGRYAVVGLPCVLKSLRLAQDYSPRLEKRVVLALGLVCGKNKSKYFTDVLVKWAGVQTQQVRSVNYRDKQGILKSSDYYFKAKAGGLEGRVRMSQGYAELFSQPWFDLGSCKVCDDIFAETADATFMDAWLPEFLDDVKGTSLVISRNPMISKLLEPVMDSIAVEKVVASQKGVVERKRKFLSWELARVGQKCGRLHLTTTRGWRNFLPHNLLEKYRRLQGRKRAAEVYNSMESAQDWFDSFTDSFQKWQSQDYRLALSILSLRNPFEILRIMFGKLGKVFK